MITIDNSNRRLDLVAAQVYGAPSDDALRTLVWANRVATRDVLLRRGAVLATPAIEPPAGTPWTPPANWWRTL